jgi:hypothetical protein
MERLSILIPQCHLRCAVFAGAFAAAGLAGAGTAAVAQGGRLDAQYAATLGGLPVGSATWQIVVDEDRFTAAIRGTTSGLLRVFSTGRGTSASRGSVADGNLSATSYSSSIATDRRYDEVQMQLNSGTVKNAVVEPPNSPDPDRVPVQDSHRRGIVDPLTAAILRVPGNGDTFVPQACNPRLAVFDGRMRYDMQLAYKRLEKVKSVRGYQGTVVVCSVQFRPIAGHVPTRSAIKYLTGLRDSELWLAPIAGTRFMVPYRVSVQSPMGQAVAQATHFVTTAQSSRPTPTSVRPQ